MAYSSAEPEGTGSSRLAIAANFVAEPIARPLQLLLADLKLGGDVTFAPYDQVIQELVTPGSLLRSEGAHRVILLQLERWLPAAADDAGQFQHNLRDFTNALTDAAQQSSNPFIVLVCPPSPDRRCDRILVEMEDLLCQWLTNAPGVDIVTTTQREALYPSDHGSALFDPHTNQEAQIPYSALGFATLATLVARRLFAHRSRPKKVIVVDCDNTLWAGECGEVGPENVTVGPARQRLQQLLIQQAEAGRLLCLCSKNEARNALEVFECHTDMRLRKEHLTSWRINWKPKPENLRSLREELSLGLDSFVFIDDDTFECEAMRTLCPEVLTLQLPPDETQIAAFLRDVWELDIGPTTAEDKQRTQFYRDNAARERARTATPSLDAFIASLQLQVSITPLQQLDLPRAAQLTERTNQFNLNGIRRSVPELQRFLAIPGVACELVRARDRFGDYGVVGLLIYRMADECLAVETLLLSCRALGKGLEAKLTAHLLETANSHNAAEIAFDYRKSERNALIPPFLSGFGATEANGRYTRVVAPVVHSRE